MKYIILFALAIGFQPQANAAAGSEYVLLGAGTSYILIQATGGVVKLNQNKDIAENITDEARAEQESAKNSEDAKKLINLIPKEENDFPKAKE